jgi:hypothetical protein
LSICPPSLSTIFNFPTFIQQSLRLPICTVARGQVDGPSENIPSECMVTPTTVQLLVVWKDTDSDDYCPTQHQVHILERKIQRPSGWSVDYHHPHFWECVPTFFRTSFNWLWRPLLIFSWVFCFHFTFSTVITDRHISNLTSTCSNQM